MNDEQRERARKLLSVLATSAVRPRDLRATLRERIPAETDADAGIARVFEALIAAGRSLEKLILEANPLRLAAIGQWIEVSDEALASQDRSGVIAETRQLVFQQLVAAGVTEAVRVGDVTRDANVVSAWSTCWSSRLRMRLRCPRCPGLRGSIPRATAPSTSQRPGCDVEVDYQVKRLDGRRLRRNLAGSGIPAEPVV